MTSIRNVVVNIYIVQLRLYVIYYRVFASLCDTLLTLKYGVNLLSVSVTLTRGYMRSTFANYLLLRYKRAGSCFYGM